MKPNQKKLAEIAGKLAAQIASQFGGEVVGFQDAIVDSMNTESERLSGEKAKPIDFVDSGLALSRGIAEEIGSPKVTKLVDDLCETVDDAAHGRFIEVFGDLLKDFQNIKAVTKDSNK